MKRCTLLPTLLVLVFSVLLSWRLVADDEHHGHDPSALGQLGTVHFPVSCSPTAQETFARGVALLHSFWYEEAEKQFNRASQEDPRCAMAHWGVAMSLYHQLWENPASSSLNQGWDAVQKARSIGAPTPRERDYIAAVAAFYADAAKIKHADRAQKYSQAMEQVYHRYPEDHEAAIFYSLSLLGSEPRGSISLERRRKAASVLEKIFAEEPNHPGVAHYLIHTYDTPQLAAEGLSAARRYAQIAPAAPHALHMPSHIFSRLGLWQDDINSNLASIAATRKSAAMHMGGAEHQFHAMDFLVYAYLQSGREADAQRSIDEMDALKGTHSGRWSYVSAVSRALYALELRRWKDAAVTAVPSDSEPWTKAFLYRARATGAARSGNVAAAQKAVQQIEAVRKSLSAQGKKDDAKDVDLNRREAAAWLAFAEHKNDSALQLMRVVADEEDKTGSESNEMPAREMLADMLLELDRPQQALLEYQASLKAAPNRFNGIYGAARAAEAAGQADVANSYYSQLVKLCDGAHSDRPELEHARKLLAKR
jgi:hypothetical protein